MSNLIYQNETYILRPDETVLAGLERLGVTIPSSCRSGICQTCRMTSEGGPPPVTAQRGLTPAQCDRGDFLACLCVPERDMRIASPADASTRHVVRIAEKIWLSSRILRLRLEVSQDYRYRAGQFLNLIRADGVTRSYSIASIPGVDATLDLQVARVPNGQMSGWLAEEAQAGDTLEIGPALGECYYRDDNAEQTLVLIGTGSGLAPLYGVARDALRRGHRGAIHLYHGSGNVEGLYLTQELADLVTKHDNFFYVPCVSRDATASRVRAGRAHHVALTDLANLKGARVYLCGHPDMVKDAQRAAFLAGASMSDIYSDAFASPPQVK